MGMFLITTSFVRRLTDTFSKGEGKWISPFLRGFAERKLIVESLNLRYSFPFLKLSLHISLSFGEGARRVGEVKG